MKSTEASSSSTSRRGTWVLLAVLVLAGLVLRVWFASSGLDQSRFWDERYSFINIRSVFETGDLLPANAYYPSPVFNVPAAAVMRASEAYSSRTGDPAYRMISAENRLTPMAYFLCRLLQGAYGVAAIVFTFLAGRALFTPWIGLLSALMVTFMPWPIHASAYIKPDSLLLMTIALSLYAMLSAIQKPTVFRYLVVGVAIALAMSAKLTGGMIAISLTVATVMMGWHDRRRWSLLVLAGATSALSFVLLNPYWMSYLQFLTGLKRDYAMRAGFHGSTRLAIPGEVLGFLTGEALHGLVLGTVSLAGLGWFVWVAFKRGSELSRLERAKHGIMVVFPVIYTVVYIVQTPYFKPNNFLPLVPFTSISLAWVLVSGFRRAVGLWPSLRHPLLAGLAFVALWMWLASQGWLYVYRTFTPTTRDEAVAMLSRRLPPQHGRLIYLESWDEPEPQADSKPLVLRGMGAAKVVKRLARVGAEKLKLSDGVMFYEDHLTSNRAKFYEDLIARVPPHRVHFFRSEPFVRRGPAFVTVFFRPRRSEPFFELAPRSCGPEVSGGCLTLDLPREVDPRKAYNLFAYFSSEALETLPGVKQLDPAAIPRLELADRSLDLLRASRQRDGNLFLTERFRLDGSLREVRLRREQPFAEGEMRIQLIEWTINF
ncbi:MAG: glycosyltransferase family 39 protein [bacterium]|nr:glycosyltransferase family 39 protein [bacterium]